MEPNEQQRPDSVKYLHTPSDPFVYDGYDLDTTSNGVRLTCRYSIGQLKFVETMMLESANPRWSRGLDEAARLVFLLAGVSYYKTVAPSTIDLGNVPTTPLERRFVKDFYQYGLAEFAYRNQLDLSRLTLTGPDRLGHDSVTVSSYSRSPLVPFGGGIDSIVAIESIKRNFANAALFVLNPAQGRFDAIENVIRVAGLEVVRCERRIDPKLRDAVALGFLNGHVPITGIISAVAVMAAVLGEYGCVVMSNEWSASLENLVIGGRDVNHQWSKSIKFEQSFRELLNETFTSGPEYFSILRPRSELWIAKRFSELTQYHRVFRSCNRAFHQDRSRRLESWCGKCDKCCFIDLILSAYMNADDLREIFANAEPLDNKDLVDSFRVLLGISAQPKPFECVGGIDECRAAIIVASQRSDRSESSIVQILADEVRARKGASANSRYEGLMKPMAEHYIPDDYYIDDDN